MADAFADWTQRLRASDAGALNELMEAMHPVLLGYATRIAGERDAAYDILQEAFIKLWRVRSTLDPERSLKALIYRIVYTLALNDQRMKRRETMAHTTLQTEAETRVATPDEELDAGRLGERMSAWIGELPPRRQEAFRLSRFEGLSHEEIAEVMDLAPQTVTKHIMLALQFLRDRFRSYKASEQGL
jgi:RNA polymerase sigma-70 factor (ECF subfamily)